jgi:hypothetical protein
VGVNAEAEQLGRALAAAPWWPEALAKHGVGAVVTLKSWKRPSRVAVLARTYEGKTDALASIQQGGQCGVELADCIPVLDAPATLGVLWAMLYEVAYHFQMWGLDAEYGASVACIGRASRRYCMPHRSTIPGVALARALLEVRGGS